METVSPLAVAWTVTAPKSLVNVNEKAYAAGSRKEPRHVPRLTPEQHTNLETAAGAERQTRTLQRYRGLLLLGDGQTFRQLAQRLGCGESMLYRWVEIWREAGLATGPHSG